MCYFRTSSPNRLIYLFRIQNQIIQWNYGYRYNQKKIDKLLGIKTEEDDEDENENDTIFIIKLSAKSEVSLSASVGIVLGDKSFVLAILVWIKGLLGNGEIGVGLIINFNRADIFIDTFYEFEAFHISLFLKIEIIMNFVLL